MKNIVQITLLDRQDIYRMRCLGKSLREIAKVVNKAASSIKREIERNGAQSRQERRQKYWFQAALAQERMLLRRCRKRPRMRLKNMRVRRYVEQKLTGERIKGKLYPGLSPELISERISIDLAGESISHEAIYQWIFIEARHLIQYLERLGRYRRRRKRTENLGRKSNDLGTKIHISNRSDEANERKEFGHHERDCIVSCKEGRSALHACQERKTRHLSGRKIPDLKAESGKAAVVEMLRDRPLAARLSVAQDNGSENYKVESIEKILVGTKIFWCTPHAAWERGGIERANRTLRKVFSKGTNFDEVTEEEVQDAIWWYNNRPMTVLGGYTPQEMYDEEMTNLKKAA
jgi:IS30 family transposase